jgi:hypothetical protein
MRWLDGEMTREEARAVEKRVEGSAGAPGRSEERAKVDAMRQLGDVMRARYDAAVDDAKGKLDGLWARIEKQMEPATAPAPAKRRERETAQPDTGIWARIRDWFDAYRGHVLTGAVCAAAAALIVVVARPPRTVEVPGPVRVVEVQAGDEPVYVPASAPAEFEDIETAEGSPDVLKIPAQKDGEQPTVILVNIQGLRAI